jgi:hypothetical protein
MEPPKLRHCPKFLGLAGAASLRLSKVSVSYLLRSEGGVDTTIATSPSSGAAVIRNCDLKNEPVNKFAAQKKGEH